MGNSPRVAAAGRSNGRRLSRAECGRFHRQGAVAPDGAQGDGAVFFSSADQLYRLIDKDRRFSSKTEPGDGVSGHPCGKQGQACRYQWTMHDNTGIALNVARIVCIVMDSMSVIGQRRIAKQFLRLRAPFACDLSRFWRHKRLHLRHRHRAWRIKVDERPLLGPDLSAVLLDRAPNGYEEERSGCSAFLFNRINPFNKCGLTAGPEFSEHLDLGTGKHSPFETDRRQKISSRRVPIPSDPAVGNRFAEEIDPMPRHGEQCRTWCPVEDQEGRSCGRSMPDQAKWSFGVFARSLRNNSELAC